MCVSALTGLATLTFDLETGMRVASKVGNVRSKFGCSNYSLVRDGRTDKSNAYWPLPYVRGHTPVTNRYSLKGRRDKPPLPSVWPSSATAASTDGPIRPVPDKYALATDEQTDKYKDIVTT